MEQLPEELGDLGQSSATKDLLGDTGIKQHQELSQLLASPGAPMVTVPSTLSLSTSQHAGQGAGAAGTMGLGAALPSFQNSIKANNLPNKLSSPPNMTINKQVVGLSVADVSSSAAFTSGLMTSNSISMGTMSMANALNKPNISTQLNLNQPSQLMNGPHLGLNAAGQLARSLGTTNISTPNLHGSVAQASLVVTIPSTITSTTVASQVVGQQSANLGHATLNATQATAQTLNKVSLAILLPLKV